MVSRPSRTVPHDEQRRVSIELSQHCEVWIEAERSKVALPYDMRWSAREGRDYLYRYTDRNGNVRNLGLRGPETEAMLPEYQTEKADVTGRVDASGATLEQTCRLHKAVRLPSMPSKAAAILREADRRSLLGSHLLVVGTDAIPAYILEAGGHIDAPRQTNDFDVTWTAMATDVDVIWPMMKAVDSTYTVNIERPFQARNASAYEVEILTAPSRATTLWRTDRTQPVPLPE